MKSLEELMGGTPPDQEKINRFVDDVLKVADLFEMTLAEMRIAAMMLGDMSFVALLVDCFPKINEEPKD